MLAQQPTESRMNPTSNNPSAEFAALPETLLGLKTRITSCAIGREKDQPSADVCDGRPHHDIVIAALADGVGRAEMGREAAEKTVQNFISYFKSRPRSWSIRKALEEFARLINRSLHQESMTRFERVERLLFVSDRGLSLGDNADHRRVSSLAMLVRWRWHCAREPGTGEALVCGRRSSPATLHGMLPRAR